MSRAKTLKSSIDELDERSVQALRDVYLAWHETPTFVRQLTPLLRQAAYQHAASWLLKHHLEQDHDLTSLQVTQVYGCFELAEHWETQLHLLQCIPYLPIGTKHKTQVDSFVRQALTADNKFVRAWAYHGLYELALVHPEYLADAKQQLKRAVRVEAPSVKARVRRILNHLQSR